MNRILSLAMLSFWIGSSACHSLSALAADTPSGWLAPTALAASPDGRFLFVACAKSNVVLTFDVQSKQVVRQIAVPKPPLGLVVDSAGSRLYVACAAPQSCVCVVDGATGAVLESIATGHTAVAPILSSNEKSLYVCCQFDNAVAVIDLADHKETLRIPVRREPVAATLTKDGRHLLVANLLPMGRADQDDVAAVISVIDTETRQVVKELRLPSGSGSVNDIRLSPDGRYAVATHIVARFHLPATQLERGWMCTNAKTIVDVQNLQIVDTVLVDNVDTGAANPWGIGWSADGRIIAIAHAGTHEVSLVDFPGVVDRLSKPRAIEASNTNVYTPGSVEPVNDLGFLVGLRQRVKLPAGDLGPRAVVVVGQMVYTANYFSDTLTAIRLGQAGAKPESLSLGGSDEMDLLRKGEFYFHDATICFQGWQSCASCHPGDARADGFNWDLINDGIGNPKNNKSLLLTHQTPPAMSLGVRDTAEAAVRAGIRHILFTVQPEEVPSAMDAYLKSLKPVPSPYLAGGKPSEAAVRGQKGYVKAGCASCHPPGLFTDLQSYDVGTRSKYDRAQETFDTPTLVEVWRTAPYLHDGSAATIRDVLTTQNSKDQHGQTSKLTAEELDDLCAYVLSL